MLSGACWVRVVYMVGATVPVSGACSVRVAYVVGACRVRVVHVPDAIRTNTLHYPTTQVMSLLKAIHNTANKSISLVLVVLQRRSSI